MWTERLIRAQHHESLNYHKIHKIISAIKLIINSPEESLRHRHWPCTTIVTQTVRRHRKRRPHTTSWHYRMLMFRSFCRRSLAFTTEKVSTTTSIHMNVASLRNNLALESQTYRRDLRESVEEIIGYFAQFTKITRNNCGKSVRNERQPKIAVFKSTRA